MIEVEVKIHQPAGYDVRMWDLSGEKPKLLNTIFFNTKKEANRMKKFLEGEQKKLNATQ